jgi:hypothetical protein
MRPATSAALPTLLERCKTTSKKGEEPSLSPPIVLDSGIAGSYLWFGREAVEVIVAGRSSQGMLAIP